MIQSLTTKSRRLYLSASVLAIVAVAPAMAQTTVLTSSSANYDLLTGNDKYVELSSGTNGYFAVGDSGVSDHSGNATVPAGKVGLLSTATGDGGWQNGIGSDPGWAMNWSQARSNAAIIKVDSGATLEIEGRNYNFDAMFQASGDVTFGAAYYKLYGSTGFLGNLILQNGTTVEFGTYDWNCCSHPADVTFGPNTNIDMNGGEINFDQVSGTLTVGGWIAGSSAADIVLGQGSLTVNGNYGSTGKSFAGTVNVASGASFTVGDSTHASAVFGNPTGKNAQINVTGTGTLSGYGTIYGNVHNDGVITAGGTSGVNGGLTINGNLTLTDNSILKTTMTPTGVSGLVINGNMVAAGEMDINVATGNYGNGVYPILVVNGGTISGSFSRVLTTGSLGDVIAGLKQSSNGFTIVTEEGSSPQVYGHVFYANRLALTNFVGSLYDAMAMTPSSGATIDTWATVNGGTVNLSRGGLGFDEKSYGLSLGGMHRFERHGGVVGAAFSYRHGNMSVKDSTATAMTNGYDLGIYGGAEVNQVRFDGTAFYSINTADTTRPMGSDGTSKSSGDGYAYGVSGEISRDVFRGLMTPYVRGMYARVHMAAAAEAGSLQFDLKHDAMNANTFVTDLGLRVHLLRLKEDGRIKIDANFAWRYDLSNPGETAAVSFANFTSGSNSFFWKGDSKNALVVGLDGTGEIADGLEVYGRLNGMLTSYRREGELSAGVKYRF